MPVSTAVESPRATVRIPARAPRAELEDLSWKPRHLLSTLSDRRSLRKIGGMNAYLTQVRWSVWWALRRRPTSIPRS